MCALLNKQTVVSTLAESGGFPASRWKDMDKNVFLNVFFIYFGLRFKVKTLICISLELIVSCH